MSAEQPTIIYTLTDEAPLLATYAFLPIIRTFTEPAGINVESSDISVPGIGLPTEPRLISISSGSRKLTRLHSVSPYIAKIKALGKISRNPGM